MTLASLAERPLPLPLLRRGKVRDVHVVDDERLLLVASDRVSAFDVVLAERVPYKGAVLTGLTAWWLRQLGDLVPHHLLSADAGEIIDAVPVLAPYREALAGRTMLCRRTAVFPIECVVRGYLSGSAWKEYRESGTLAGEPLTAGLRESDRFDPPRFSPATKAETGHDENIPVAEVARVIGAASAAALESLSRLVYARGRDVAGARGIIIADTKFEFGRDAGGTIRLIDEVLTPDSSRFWDARQYAPGGPQPSFDKQPLRDYLDAERRAGRWNGEAPPPPLPASVIEETSARYLDVYQRLTGAPLPSTDP
ncbi:MAG: phosphoribosylaminoimidazole-succinocarboxamide synthase [Gemmatimonadetes bacterium]|nr:phosphoribosylaminoimidazole-succinocarboxamide synthase [Gemmatimonadota bacterium]